QCRSRCPAPWQSQRRWRPGSASGPDQPAACLAWFQPTSPAPRRWARETGGARSASRAVARAAAAAAMTVPQARRGAAATRLRGRWVHKEGLFSIAPPECAGIEPILVANQFRPAILSHQCKGLPGRAHLVGIVAGDNAQAIVVAQLGKQGIVA